MQLVIDEERVIKVDGVALQGLGGLHRPGSGAAPACRAHPPGALAHARRADHSRADAGRGCWSLWAGAAPLRAAAIPPGPGHHGAPGEPTPGHRHRDLQAPGLLTPARSAMRPAPWCGRGWNRPLGSALMIPAPATGTRTATAPKSATITSPPSPPRRAG